MRVTIKGRWYLAMAVTSFAVGTLAGRPELIVLAAPFAVLLVAAAALPQPEPVEARISVDRREVAEGEDVEAEVALTAPAPVDRLWWRMLGAAAVDVPPAWRATSAGPGNNRALRMTTRVQRWGEHRLGPLAVVQPGLLHLFERHVQVAEPVTLRSFPRPERVLAPLPCHRTRPAAGDHRSTARGSGTELSDVRAFQLGDRARDVNWRATARRQAPQITVRHPERAADVVLLVDTFAEARSPAGGTLDLAVRAAVGLAQAHLARRDSVGLIAFGGVVGWLEPGTGSHQHRRIAESLLRTEVVFSYVFRDISVVPPRLLAPDGLVIALSPLLDARMVAALTQLAGRGYELVVIELEASRFVDAPATEEEELALRLWALEHDALRRQFARRGVPVERWDGAAPLQHALNAVARTRRRTAVA